MLCDQVRHEIQPKIVDGRYKYIYKGDTICIPPKIPVIAGEIVHHLRTSLDYLIWELTVANTGKPPENERNSGFPSVGDRRPSMLKKLTGVGQQAAKSIEQNLSPKFGYGLDLRALQELDNICKHRKPLIAICWAKPRIEHIESAPLSQYLNQTVAYASYGRIVPDKVVLELIDSPENLDIDFDFGIYVGLNEALYSTTDEQGNVLFSKPLLRQGKMPNVIETLENYCDIVRKVTQEIWRFRK